MFVFLYADNPARSQLLLQYLIMNDIEIQAGEFGQGKTPQLINQSYGETLESFQALALARGQLLV